MELNELNEAIEELRERVEGWQADANNETLCEADREEAVRMADEEGKELQAVAQLASDYAHWQSYAVNNMVTENYRTRARREAQACKDALAKLGY